MLTKLIKNSVMCFQTKITNWVSTKKTQSNADDFTFLRVDRKFEKWLSYFRDISLYRDAQNFALLFSKRAGKNGKKSRLKRRLPTFVYFLDLLETTARKCLNDNQKIKSGMTIFLLHYFPHDSIMNDKMQKVKNVVMSQEKMKK